MYFIISLKYDLEVMVPLFMLMSFVEREEGNFEDDDNVRSQLFGVPKRRICNFTQKNRRAYLALKSFESFMERSENGIGKRKWRIWVITLVLRHRWRGLWAVWTEAERLPVELQPPRCGYRLRVRCEECLCDCAIHSAVSSCWHYIRNRNILKMLLLEIGFFWAIFG